LGLKLLILGSNSSLPAYGRHHTSQILNIGGLSLLIDCGDGTQYQLLKYKVKTSKVDHIFISHLHGDHYLGLMGILFSQQLTGRKNKLTIYGQRGLDEIITTHLKYSGATFNYKINFIELNPEQQTVIFENNEVEIQSFPLTHRIPCCGFLFKEKTKERKIIGEKIPRDFPIENFQKLKNGEDILDERGKILFKNEELTSPPNKSASYAYCSDTGFDETLIEKINMVDLLYHEATFLKEKKKWARQTFHSTTEDAAIIAKQAKVGKLLIGHFSARYNDVQPFIDECRDVFPKTLPAVEGEEYIVR